jgi:hypothetical protein
VYIFDREQKKCVCGCLKSFGWLLDHPSPSILWSWLAGKQAGAKKNCAVPDDRMTCCFSLASSSIWPICQTMRPSERMLSDMSLTLDREDSGALPGLIDIGAEIDFSKRRGLFHLEKTHR